MQIHSEVMGAGNSEFEFGFEAIQTVRATGFWGIQSTFRS